MLKSFRKSRSNAYHQIFNLILLLFFVVYLLPVVPIAFVIIILFGMWKDKRAYGLSLVGGMTCLFIALCITGLSTWNLSQEETNNALINTFTHVFKTNFECLINADVTGMLKNYLTYSVGHWFVIISISFFISTYVLYRFNRYSDLESVDVKSFEKKVESMTEQSQPIVSVDTKLSTLLGYNQNKKPVYCEDDARHVFVCGTTGSGKTVLLSNFIKSGIEKDYGMLIVDGKGDTDNNSILSITQRFCQEHGRELYVINMNDPKGSIKYNPFARATETMCKDMLINMSYWSEEHYKANTERYIQRLLKLLKLKGEQLSFENIISHIPIEKFEELSAQLAKGGVISKEEHIKNTELIKSSGKIAENASARFSTIAESEIGEIFDENGIDIFTALESGAVILFVLNPLLYPETSPALGRLILIDAKQAVNKLFRNNQNRTFFIFDEINVYASPVLVDLINKSRSAGVTCIPATQSLADLEAVAGESFKQQIIENCNNYAVLRQNSFSSAEEWAKTLGTKEVMKMTYQLSSTEATGMGTAKKTREFIVHPDEIKALPQGQGVFLSRDNGQIERIKIIKPF